MFVTFFGTETVILTMTGQLHGCQTLQKPVAKWGSIEPKTIQARNRFCALYTFEKLYTQEAAIGYRAFNEKTP